MNASRSRKSARDGDHRLRAPAARRRPDQGRTTVDGTVQPRPSVRHAQPDADCCAVCHADADRCANCDTLSYAVSDAHHDANTCPDCNPAAYAYRDRRADPDPDVDPDASPFSARQWRLPDYQPL